MLGEQRGKLEAELKAATEHLKAKVAELGKTTPIASVADARTAALAGGSSSPAEVPVGSAARFAGPATLFETVTV